MSGGNAGTNSEEWLLSESRREDSTARNELGLSGEKNDGTSQQGSRSNVQQGTKGSSRPGSAQSRREQGSSLNVGSEKESSGQGNQGSRSNVKQGTKGSGRPGSTQSRRQDDPSGSRRSVRDGGGGSPGPSNQQDASTVLEQPLNDGQQGSAEKGDGQEKTDSASPTPLSSDTKLELEPWPIQKREHWPESGRHILAQYDDQSVVVYQAYKKSIADYAVENQKFGGDEFSFHRMSWIKTNFLWMMYRSGWATKPNQERILAVKLTREGWDEILSKAYTVTKQKQENVQTKDIEVRLQWDPDHGPNGGSVIRRSIQLGLKNEILRRYGTEFILEIEDITGFVQSQYNHVTNGCPMRLITPKERVYEVADESVAEGIGLDKWQPKVEREVSELY